jgi:hypothetical protein
MNQDEEIRRGHEAARIMADPLVRGAFDAIEQGIYAAMKKVKVADSSTQHELIVMLQLHAKWKGIFQEHMETGKLASFQKETMAQKLRRNLRRVR